MPVKDTHEARVKFAILRYCVKKPCPVCGLKYWNGNIHPYKGKRGRTKKDTIWCNGKVKGGIYPRQKDEKNEQTYIEGMAP